jgi:dCMP deaminase
MSRLGRKEYFMSIAELAAQRGTCSRAQVGCVLVDDRNRIKATGYNSSHPGSCHCDDHGCLVSQGHCIRTIHAEVAAVLNLEKQYNNLTAYVTHEPCMNCYKILTAAGIKKIYYKLAYGEHAAEYYELQNEIGVEMKGFANVPF